MVRVSGKVSLLSIAFVTMMTAACATSGARPQPFPGAPNPFSAPATADPATSVTGATPPATSPVPATNSDTTSPATVLPVLIPPVGTDTAATSDGTASAGSAGRKADALLKTALKFQGTRYRLGGDSPASGFDCSGFVRFVFEQYQIELPRTVVEQYSVGKKVKTADVKAGDLLFFSTTAKGATHVGIALGAANPGEFVHAPGAGGSVRIEHFDTAYWSTKLVGIRRVF